MKVRPTAVAGSFYPDDPQTLQQQMQLYLSPPIKSSSAVKAIKALVVPHAGYIYSGDVAAKAYVKVSQHVYQRIILLGPSHRVAFSGIAACDYQSYASPLGEVPVDTKAIAELVDSGLAVYLDEAHRWEHSLEVQIPFIQSLFPQATLIPLVVGDAEWTSVQK